jgi:hypothetical protein
MWLTIDPGESTGWAAWEGTDLLTAGTTPMWEFADALWTLLVTGTSEILDLTGSVERIVCENFTLYPDKAKSLHHDEFRTVRLIGAIFFMCRTLEIEFITQPAYIKERAIAGGAKSLFYRPLHENRHQNDAIMHGVFYIQTELTCR